MGKITLEEHVGTPELSRIKQHWLKRTGFPQHMPPDFVAKMDARLQDVEAHRLPEMDAHGIDVQIISISEPGVEAMDDPADAVEQAGRFNDHLAGIVARHPTRFRALASLPLQEPDAAVKELSRCVRELGFVGAMVNGHSNGHYLDEPRFDTLWGTAADLGVPIYLHPTDPLPDQIKIYEGREDLLGPVWNWGVETGTHAMRIVFGGVFDRHPKATLVLGHMGEMIPYMIPRIDKRWLAAEGKKPPRRRPSSYFRTNVMVTTTGVLSNASLRCAIDVLGVDRVMFSVDYPYEPTADATAWIDSAPLTDAERAAVCHGNASKLFGLAGAG